MPDVFQTLAEFSIGLAGFAAIVVAIARRQSHLYLSRIMITNALVPGMLVLVPPVAVQLGLEGAIVWRLTSGLTLAAILAMSGAHLSRVASGESHGLNRSIHLGSWVVGYVVFGLNVANVADVCDGMLAALDRGRTGERYILGGENLTGRELVERIAEVAGGRAPRRAFRGIGLRATV